MSCIGGVNGNQPSERRHPCKISLSYLNRGQTASTPEHPCEGRRISASRLARANSVDALRPARCLRLALRKIRVHHAARRAADGEISALRERCVAAIEIADGAVDLHADRIARIVSLRAGVPAREERPGHEHESSAAHLSAAGSSPVKSPAPVRADDSDRRRDHRSGRRNRDSRCR